MFSVEVFADVKFTIYSVMKCERSENGSSDLSRSVYYYIQWAIIQLEPKPKQANREAKIAQNANDI